MNLTLHEEIYALLCKFQYAFDTHDWEKLSACLGQQICVDYSSFRGTPPGEISKEAYIELRKSALSQLRMQHNFSNLEVTENTDGIIARCNYAIYRFSVADQMGIYDYFHSFGRYIFQICREKSNLLIVGITQNQIASQGNSSLHLGVPAQS